MSEADLFLNRDELEVLTGRSKLRKGKQIEWLRSAGIPFRINATGHPIVTRAAIIGIKEPARTDSGGWTPRVLEA